MDVAPSKKGDDLLQRKSGDFKFYPMNACIKSIRRSPEMH